MCLCACPPSLLFIWALQEVPVLSFWSKLGRTTDTETEMCVDSALKVSAASKAGQRNWTLSLTWGLCQSTSNEQGWMWFIREMLAGKQLFLHCSNKHKRDVNAICVLFRYLCDFAYYCSLYHGQRRAALIHIPSSGSLASADRLVPLLQALILTMLQQLEDSKQHHERHAQWGRSSCGSCFTLKTPQ